MKANILLALSLAGILAITGCTKDDSTSKDDTSVKTDYEGKWDFSTVLGLNLDIEGSTFKMTQSETKNYVTYNTEIEGEFTLDGEKTLQINDTVVDKVTITPNECKIMAMVNDETIGVKELKDKCNMDVKWQDEVDVSNCTPPGKKETLCEQQMHEGKEIFYLETNLYTGDDSKDSDGYPEALDMQEYWISK